MKRPGTIRSFLNSKWSCRRYVPAEEKLNETGVRLETSQRHSLTQLAYQMGMSVSSAQNYIELLHLYPQWSSNWVHSLYNTDCETWLNLWSVIFVGCMAEKYTPHLCCWMVIACISVDMWNLTITGFPYYSIKWMLSLMCGVLWL